MLRSRRSIWYGDGSTRRYRCADGRRGPYTRMTSTDTLTTFVVPGPHLMSALLGQRDQNLRQIEQQFPESHVSVRGNEISVRGGDSARVGRLFEELVGLLEHGQELDERTIERSIGMVRSDERPTEVLTHQVLRGAKGRNVRPKTAGQKRYIDAIRDNETTPTPCSSGAQMAG